MKKIVAGAAILTVGIIMSGCNQKINTNNISGEKSNQTTSNRITENSTKELGSSQSNEFSISLQEAFNKYKEVYPNTELTSVELDQSFGEYYYTIEGVDDHNQYGLNIQANTGEVKKEREEVLDKDEQDGLKKKQEAIDIKNVLPIKEVSVLAEKEVGTGTATEWKLERELATTYWEVKVIEKTKEYEIKLDAQTGKILERSED